MFRALADWILAFLGMVRELQKQREIVSQLEMRVRNLEESLHLLIQEQRHDRDLRALEDKKLLLEIEKGFAVRKAPRLRKKPGKKSK